jgi:hypothetical protein
MIADMMQQCLEIVEKECDLLEEEKKKRTEKG